jgi:hypothetical protein
MTANIDWGARELLNFISRFSIQLEEASSRDMDIARGALRSLTFVAFNFSSRDV